MAPGLPEAGAGGAERALPQRLLHSTYEPPLLPVKSSSWECPVPGSRMWACSPDLKTCPSRGPVSLDGCHSVQSRL